MSSKGNHPQTWQFRFSIASMLLATAVVAICLAIARVQPGVGALVSFLTVPALIRTALVATREASSDKPLSALGKVLEFLFSWMLMLPIGLAALIVGGVAMTLASLLGYVVVALLGNLFGPEAPPSLGYVLLAYFFTVPMVAALGAGGGFLAWGIRSSLKYRPVARI